MSYRARPAAHNPLSDTQTFRSCNKHTKIPHNTTECCLQEPYQIKNEKKLDIAPRPVLQYKNKVERVNAARTQIPHIMLDLNPPYYVG